MIVIFVEFINQLTDYPINRASLILSTNKYDSYQTALTQTFLRCHVHKWDELNNKWMNKRKSTFSKLGA